MGGSRVERNELVGEIDVLVRSFRTLPEPLKRQ